MGRAGYRDGGGQKGRLWKKMDALNTFVDKAMPYIAQWAGEHPNLTVTRWRCVRPGAEGDKI